LSAYSNLRANALLTLDGSLGHDTEVLSGHYYQSFSTSSPHQIWSAAMVVSPILRGLFGLHTDAPNHQITLAPHVPADWTSFAIRQVELGTVGVDFKFHKIPDNIVLDITRTGEGDCWVEFSPAFSLRTQIASVEMNGQPLPFQLQPNGEDQHVSLRFPVKASSNQVVIHTKQDFGLSLNNDLPEPGGTSHSLRVISESWNAAQDLLRVETSGVPGSTYELGVWNLSQISSVENGTLTQQGRTRIEMPNNNKDQEEYVHRILLIHFAPP
jgi:hypothetical protein